MPSCRRPWRRARGSSISGNFIGGILGYVIEREAADRELQPARLTVDLLRPAAMEPLRVRASTVRRGRRLMLVDGEITQTHSSHEGVGTGTAVMFDHRGPIGRRC